MKIRIKNARLNYSPMLPTKEYGNTLFQSNVDCYGNTNSDYYSVVKQPKQDNVVMVTFKIESNQTSKPYFVAFDAQDNEITSYRLTGILGNSGAVEQTVMLGSEVKKYSVMCRGVRISDAYITERRVKIASFDYENSLFVNATDYSGTSVSTYRAALKRPIANGVKKVVFNSQMGSNDLTFCQFDSEGEAIDGTSIQGQNGSLVTPLEIALNQNAKYYSAVVTRPGAENSSLTEIFDE